MARLYSNENFPMAVVQALRDMGHDVLTSAEAGNANQSIPDDKVLRYAVDQGRAVLTLNRRDFIALHRQGTRHSGIVVCTFNQDFPAQAAMIHATLAATPVLDGQLLRVNRGS